MFTLKVCQFNEDDPNSYLIELVFTLLGTSIRFTPNCPELIKNIDIEAEHGTLDSDHLYGSLYMTWSQQVFVFRYDKEGEGALVIIIPVTPESMDSFRTAMRKWKSIYI